ncbi:MAG: FeoB-associated Cys-rich membrane protein [Enterocloster sp.]
MDRLHCSVSTGSSLGSYFWSLPDWQHNHLKRRWMNMIITGILVAGIVVYTIWALCKIRRDHKNGNCCGSGCSGCSSKDFCRK